MAAGTDSWPKKSQEVYEPQLQAILNVKKFRMPSVNSSVENEFPVVRFPRWVVCPKCRRLNDYKGFVSFLRASERLECTECKKTPYPARLVIACSKGHIEDFPWRWWVHGTDPCDRPVLVLNSSSKTASLAGISVYCKNCNKSRSLGEAFTRGVIPFKCTGKRPWLINASDEECDAPIRTLQRGASNLYYSSVVSTLSIPPWSEDLITELQGNPYWPALKLIPESKLIETISDLNLPLELGKSVEELYKTVKMLRDKIFEDENEIQKITPEELRELEFQAISEGTTVDTASRDFEANAVEVHRYYNEVIGAVRRVDRLREVRVLQGFTRIDPPQTGSFQPQNLAAITLDTSPDWLPAIEMRGEGIFVEFQEEKLQEWEKRPTVIARTDKINNHYSHLVQSSGGFFSSRQISPRLLLAHTFAHLLIRQFSLVCGYSSSALRERLFVREPDQASVGHAAILLYTATPDSEGSLGGLIRQSSSDRLGALISGALEEARWCSSDPLCIESAGQGYQALNLAACHACCLLPETCCEEFNRFLDRGLVVGTPQYPETGFFSSVIEKLVASTNQGV